MYDSTKHLNQNLTMPELVPVITKHEIEAVVSRLALEISSDYKKKDLILIKRIPRCSASGLIR
jgi:hypoxanthine-guanine phosphoribosyltransferase